MPSSAAADFAALGVSLYVCVALFACDIHGQHVPWLPELVARPGPRTFVSQKSTVFSFLLSVASSPVSGVNHASCDTARKFVINLELCAHFVPLLLLLPRPKAKQFATCTLIIYVACAQSQQYIIYVCVCVCLCGCVWACVHWHLPLSVGVFQFEPAPAQTKAMP